MNSAFFDTRRRLLGLSIAEIAEIGKAGERTANRWCSGMLIVPADVLAAIEDIEDRMNEMVKQLVKTVTHRSATGPVPLIRYRSQEDLEDSPHACGLPLGAHAMMIGWTADALEGEGIETVIEWEDMTA